MEALVGIDLTRIAKAEIVLCHGPHFSIVCLDMTDGTRIVRRLEGEQDKEVIAGFRELGIELEIYMGD